MLWMNRASLTPCLGAGSLLLSALALAGCATKPVAVEAASSIPFDRIYAPEVVEPAPDRTTVTVVRDSGFMGGGCIAALYLDGRKIAAIDRSEKIALQLVPGRYLLGAGPNPEGIGLCRAGAERARRETEVTVEPGAPMTYRIALSGNSELSITRTSFQK